eukprot:gene7689-8526_t
MADEPESGEHEEDAEIEIDVGTYEFKQSDHKLRRSRKNPWSFEEVQVFQKGLELFGHKWTKIADLLETRSALQVKSYANRYLKQKAQQESDSLVMISALTSSVRMKNEETNDEVDVEDVAPVVDHRCLDQGVGRRLTFCGFQSAFLIMVKKLCFYDKVDLIQIRDVGT